MTPEREAQMREMFEAWARDKAKGLSLAKGNCGWYMSPRTHDTWSGFLACASALEPMVRYGERYRFMKESVTNGKDEGYALTWCDDTFHPVDDPDTHIDAAMSAALEDGNASE